ncbi:MAG TPA: hypothetical protein VF263_23335 [Longimicrobiaceae bacterium]
MILEHGSPGVVSFTDDSSPRQDHTGLTKVSIHAQVDREVPTWFYDLLAYFPDIPGELKSKVILAHFDSLPADAGVRILTGLGKVRIHISDPREYRAKLDEIWKGTAGQPYPDQEIRAQVHAGNVFAQKIFESSEHFVARSILLDSPAARLKSWAAAITNGLGPLMNKSIGQIGDRDLDEDLAALRTKKLASLVQRVAAYASKSAAVFASALDAARAPLSDEEIRSSPFRPFYYRQRTLARDLAQVHAFDEGDAPSLARIEKRRASLLRTIRDPFYEDAITIVKPLETFDSGKTVHGQVADIAAGYAASLYGRDGLMATVRQFEYVSFNGKRISDSDAAERVRRCPVLGGSKHRT